MSRTLTVLVLAGGMALAGCSIGPKPEAYPLAVEPAGHAVDLQTRGGTRLDGELLAVEDSSLLVRAGEPPKVLRVPFEAIGRGNVDRVRLRGTPPADRDRERLRLRSRFPQGLNEPLLRRLLDLHDQTEPQTIR